MLEQNIVDYTSPALCCTPVCLFVRKHFSVTIRAIFTNFFVHVAYGRGSVLLRQGDEISRRRGNFGGCPGHSKALAVFAAAVAASFAANGIIQYARQAQTGIRKILNACDAAHRE